MLTNIYLLTLLISFLCSLISFRLHYPFHLKFFSVLIGIAAITEFVAFYGPKIWNFTNNMPVYNVYHLFEFCGTAIFFKYIISNRSIQKIINAFLIGYPVFWAISIFSLYGIGAWNSNLAVVGAVFMIVLSSAYCYKLFVSDDLISFRTSSEFWIAVALIIYYSTMLPITGLFYYLTEHFTGLADQLIDLLQVANILMYSLFIYAFLCRIMPVRN